MNSGAGVIEVVEQIRPLAPRILVTDDDEEDRRWLVTQLEDAAFEVEETKYADDAVELCKVSTFGGIVMDGRFPRGRQGEQAIAEIRKHTGLHEQLNVTYVTGDREGLRGADGDPVFDKNKLRTSFLPLVQALCRGVVRRQAGAIADGALDSLAERFRRDLKFYQSVMSVRAPEDPDRLTLLTRHEGRVASVSVPNHSDAAYVDLDVAGLTVRRVVAARQLLAVGAFEEDARIEYSVYDAGSLVIVRLSRIGEPRQDWPTLSEEAVMLLSGDERRSK